MLNQMSTEELEVLKSKAHEDMQKLKLKIENEEQTLSRNSNKVQRLKSLRDDIEISLKEVIAQVEKNSEKEKKDPSLQQQKSWTDTVAQAIKARDEIQIQNAEAQEKYKALLIEEGMCIQEIRQYHSEYEKKCIQYLKLSSHLAQREVESHGPVSDESADGITEDIKTSFLRMKFS